jgi:DNA-binding GntR family transcriptional regulator
MAEHTEMIEALQARDAPALRDVLLKHLENKRDVVIAQLLAQQTSTTPSTPHTRQA